MLNKTLYSLSLYLPETIRNIIDKNNKSKEKVYIIGNGWSSYYFAKNLDKLRYEPIIIAPNLQVLNTPKLIERVIVPDTKVEFDNPYGKKIIDEVEDIDIENKYIKTKSNSKFEYKRIVFAIGSESNDYNIPGVKEYTYKLKTISDADKLRERLITVTPYNIYIIGCGLTGIELGTKLTKCKYLWYPNIYLIDSINDILPEFKEITRKYIHNKLEYYNIEIQLNSLVQSIYLNKDKLLNLEYFNKNLNLISEYNIYDMYKKDIVIWTCGIRFNGYGKTKLYQTLNKITPIGTRGLDVNKDFSIDKTNSIYCLGDMVKNCGPQQHKMQKIKQNG